MFRQNFFFRQNFDFSTKFLFSSKFRFFVRQNFDFSTKFRFFVKISIFRQKFDFSTKIRFFDKNSIFRQNFFFFCQNFDFSTKFPFFCQNSIFLVICALTPKNDNLTIHKQEREVSAAKWLPIDEFYEKSSDFNIFFLNAYLKAKETNNLILPKNLKMKYEKFDRHMIMYYLR